jgi:1-acyl-sn-glycerol-3-phosphate acyltransferase
MPHYHQPVTKRQQFATWVIGLFGWKAVLKPPQGKKYVLVGYPHTSNWDFFPAIFFAWATGLKMSWVGKASLFKGLMRPLMLRLGGIPVDRDRSKNFVSRVADLFETRDELFLVLAAEGTRSKAEYWKTGFYYIALEANVPLALAYMDWKRKEIGVEVYFTPTGDLQADFEEIKKFYVDVTGLDPSKQSPVRLKPPEPPITS